MGDMDSGQCPKDAHQRPGISLVRDVAVGSELHINTFPTETEKIGVGVGEDGEGQRRDSEGEIVSTLSKGNNDGMAAISLGKHLLAGSTRKMGISVSVRGRALNTAGILKTTGSAWKASTNVREVNEVVPLVKTVFSTRVKRMDDEAFPDLGRSAERVTVPGISEKPPKKNEVIKDATKLNNESRLTSNNQQSTQNLPPPEEIVVRKWNEESPASLIRSENQGQAALSDLSRLSGGFPTGVLEKRTTEPNQEESYTRELGVEYVTQIKKQNENEDNSPLLNPNREDTLPTSADSDRNYSHNIAPSPKQNQDNEKYSKDKVDTFWNDKLKPRLATHSQERLHVEGVVAENQDISVNQNKAELIGNLTETNKFGVTKGEINEGTKQDVTREEASHLDSIISRDISKFDQQNLSKGKNSRRRERNSGKMQELEGHRRNNTSKEKWRADWHFGKQEFSKPHNFVANNIRDLQHNTLDSEKAQISVKIESFVNVSKSVIGVPSHIVAMPQNTHQCTNVAASTTKEGLSENGGIRKPIRAGLIREGGRPLVCLNNGKMVGDSRYGQDMSDMCDHFGMNKKRLARAGGRRRGRQSEEKGVLRGSVNNHRNSSLHERCVRETKWQEGALRDGDMSVGVIAESGHLGCENASQGRNNQLPTRDSNTKNEEIQKLNIEHGREEADKTPDEEDNKRKENKTLETDNNLEDPTMSDKNFGKQTVRQKDKDKPKMRQDNMNINNNNNNQRKQKHLKKKQNILNDTLADKNKNIKKNANIPNNNNNQISVGVRPVKMPNRNQQNALTLTPDTSYPEQTNHNQWKGFDFPTNVPYPWYSSNGVQYSGQSQNRNRRADADSTCWNSDPRNTPTSVRGPVSVTGRANAGGAIALWSNFGGVSPRIAPEIAAIWNRDLRSKSPGDNKESRNVTQGPIWTYPSYKNTE